MTLSIPTVEPESIRAGDTAKWKIRLDYYPPSVWTLTYRMRSAASKFDITASDDGAGNHLISVAADTTRGYVPDLYTWQAAVASGAERYTVREGRLCVEPDVTDMATRDARLWAERTLQAVEAVLERRATHDQQSHSIGGRTIARMPVLELIEWRDRLRAEVESATRRDRMARGLRHRGSVVFRL